MPVTDPIADMLNRIKIASNLRRDSVKVRSSKIVASIAEALQREGFIGEINVMENKKTPSQNDLHLNLKYGRFGDRAIQGLKRLSSPGRRVYSQSKNLKPVLNGLGVDVLSTPKGVLSDREARNQNVGGELLFRVW